MQDCLTLRSLLELPKFYKQRRNACAQSQTAHSFIAFKVKPTFSTGESHLGFAEIKGIKSWEKRINLCLRAYAYCARKISVDNRDICE